MSRYTPKIDPGEEFEEKTVIAFVGKAGSGKTYQCNLLEQKGFVKLSFATPLRKILFATLGIEYDEGMQKYDELKRTEIYNGLNFRNLLENLGTEGIRKYDPDFWVKCMQKEIRNQYSIGRMSICIDDLRFINEWKGLNELSYNLGFTFKCVFTDFHSAKYQDINNHESARMANWFAKKYIDLEIIKNEDFSQYTVEEMRKDWKVITNIG